MACYPRIPIDDTKEGYSQKHLQTNDEPQRNGYKPAAHYHPAMTSKPKGLVIDLDTVEDLMRSRSAPRSVLVASDGALMW